MGPEKCIVPGCSSMYEAGGVIGLFRIPKDGRLKLTKNSKLRTRALTNDHSHILRTRYQFPTALQEFTILALSISHQTTIHSDAMADLKQDNKVEEAQNYTVGNSSDPRNYQELTHYVQNLLQETQDKFQTMSEQILSRIDEMGNRVDDLEKNISELMTQAGADGPDK